MFKFVFFVYEPDKDFGIGDEMFVELKTKLTRNAEKDILVRELLNSPEQTVRKKYIENIKTYDNVFDDSNLIISIDFISSSKAWKSTLYHVHKYDELVPAKFRLIRMRSGRKFYEVKCLDAEKSVLDGYWDYIENGRIENGCGDYIYG